MSKLNIFVRLFIFVFLSFVIYASKYTEFYLNFLLINVFLAYIPFELGNLICKANNKIVIIVLSLIWLLFYPNAPYLLTDFFHLEALDVYAFTTPFKFIIKDWVVFSIITCGLLFGFMIGVISLLKVVKKLQVTFLRDEKGVKSFILIALITIASGFAIYLGRFPRLHSHYVFTDPGYIITVILQSINLTTIFFSVAMAAWQIFIIYLVKWFKEEDYI